MSERFVCVLTWRYISIVYTLSLRCPEWQTASLYVVIAVCHWLNKDAVCCLFVLFCYCYCYRLYRKT